MQIVDLFKCKLTEQHQHKMGEPKYRLKIPGIDWGCKLTLAWSWVYVDFFLIAYSQFSYIRWATVANTRVNTGKMEKKLSPCKHLENVQQHSKHWGRRGVTNWKITTSMMAFKWNRQERRESLHQHWMAYNSMSWRIPTEQTLNTEKNCSKMNFKSMEL